MVWLKVDEACRYAGGVSRKTLYAAVSKGCLKASRIGAGRNLLFSTEWIDLWLQGALATDERPADRLDNPSNPRPAGGQA